MTEQHGGDVSPEAQHFPNQKVLADMNPVSVVIALAKRAGLGVSGSMLDAVEKLNGKSQAASHSGGVLTESVADNLIQTLKNSNPY